MSYNPTDRICILGEIPCDVAVSHPHYMLMVFRAEFSVDCSIWLPKENPFPSRTVNTKIGIAHEAVSGKQVGADFLIGHGRLGQPLSYFVGNGGEVNGPDALVLTVNPVRTLAWLPYTAGSTLPQNALVCGHLVALGPTYCAEIWLPNDQRMIFGHYPHEGPMGYFAYFGILEATEMDILTKV